MVTVLLANFNIIHSFMMVLDGTDENVEPTIKAVMTLWSPHPAHQHRRTIGNQGSIMRLQDSSFWNRWDSANGYDENGISTKLVNVMRNHFRASFWGMENCHIGTFARHTLEYRTIGWIIRWNNQTI